MLTRQMLSIQVLIQNQAQRNITHDLIATSFSICAIHFFANSSSVNRLAEVLARFLTASGLGRDSAFSKP
jgi:hypothetical protein